jgi:hypothetical protein
MRFEVYNSGDVEAWLIEIEVVEEVGRTRIDE